METKNAKRQKNAMPSADFDELNELNEKLNGMIRKIMGRRTASTIAKKCGVSVSTITRIKNGENKRGISEELLHKIWKTRDSDCDIDLSQLMSLNSEVSNAYMQRENAKWRQERQEIDFLEKQIQKSMLNSGVFLKKVSETYEILPQIELYPDMSYEVLLANGKSRRLLFFTEFYSKRRIERLEKRKEDSPEYPIISTRHYRTVMEFREMRALHSEYDNSELIIVFNYEDAFRYNVDILKRLSNKDNVTLVLMDPDSGKLQEEVCLDGRKKGILKELKLI